MKTKKETIYTTDKNGNGYKIEFVSKTKRHLKEGVKQFIVVILLLLAIAFIIKIDYETTKDAIEHCEKQTNGAWYCQDLR